VEKPGEDLGVDARAWNRRADTDDDDDAERKDDALAQFRYLKTIGESRKHVAGVAWRSR
jgi:hypothetical protein